MAYKQNFASEEERVAYDIIRKQKNRERQKKYRSNQEKRDKINKARRDRRANDPEYRKAVNQKTRERKQNNPELRNKNIQYLKEYYQKNKDVLLPRRRDLKNSNPEKYREYLNCSLRWKKNNAEKVQAYSEALRQKRRESPEERAKWLAYYKERRRKKREQRNRLFEAMTNQQRTKFLANEKKIRLEKKREKFVNAAFAKQIEKLDKIISQKEQVKTKIQETIELQVANLAEEKERLDRQRINSIVAKVQAMRLSRAGRYKITYMSPRDRYLWAIDYYYELIYSEQQAA